MRNAYPRLILIAASSAFLALAPGAFAATSGDQTSNGSQGVTSGPAANTPAVPNTAVEKNAMQSGQTSANPGEMKTAGAAATGAGAQGVAAKPGTEAGHQPQPSKTQ